MWWKRYWPEAGCCNDQKLQSRMSVEMYKNIISALLQSSFAVTLCSFALFSYLLKQFLQFGSAYCPFHLMSLNAWKQFGPSSKFLIGPFCTTPSNHSNVVRESDFQKAARSLSQTENFKFKIIESEQYSPGLICSLKFPENF